jgi:hypothetical protein
MGEFKQGEFSINLKDERMDNAQYIIMVILEKLKIKIDDESLKQTSKTLLSKIITNKSGLSVGKMSNMFGQFEFFLNGIPKIYTSEGNMIKSSSEFKSYLTGEQDIHTLHFESKAYIQVINHSHPENYYGVFYSLNDAIKICSENDLIKVGEITS